MPIFVLTHNDADGLSAAALLKRAFRRAGKVTRVRILRRGENPWSNAVREEVMQSANAGLLVTDLGVRAEPINAETCTVFIDHHVPQGVPTGATVISGYGEQPTPTSSLLAWQCAGALADVDDLLWLAALGIIGDLGSKASFDELATAKRRYSATALQQATALINASRRASAGDARPAFDLLTKAGSPRDVISGNHPETAILRSAQLEVNAALQTAKRVAPKIRNGVALILFDSPCQVHPLIAQTWRVRLKGNIVIAANSGYRQGWVHFSARSATGTNLVDFLRERAPEGADENYGSGHEQATGGALRPDAWNEFVGKLGFGPEVRVVS
ncbi:phosphoesterase [Pelagibacterium sp. H642]|uniref:phosphoesterase n=1 Tax=Pelagibacterium sp. H642 TaxID=1881069 RepID=UPI002814B6C7|nr:phosphoesterase [Pelagibacterium sp. H642]WMT92917.1 phosphoesterase [Pelagibacterium sp. H642]